MISLSIFTCDGDVLTYPRLLSVVVQQDNDLCFTYVDALHCVITEIYHLEGDEYFKIRILY